MMNKKEHIARHIMLHKKFDELLADFIRHTDKLPSKTNLMEFLEWSHQQTIDPDEEE